MTAKEFLKENGYLEGCSKDYYVVKHEVMPKLLDDFAAMKVKEQQGINEAISKSEIILQLIKKIESECGKEIRSYEGTTFCRKGKITVVIKIEQ